MPLRSEYPTNDAVTPARRAALHHRLLEWFAVRRRDLPWRRTRDPYGIWVSEVMLQQTQVATVLPYYARFLARFPGVRDLAAASEAEVLAAWAGLGYYRRARHLHAAARAVVREHGGAVPRDADAFGALPGVGRYTRGAVLSIAFDTALPVLDGNVARVLARVFERRDSVRAPRGAAALWALAASLVPARGAGDWNQALMELGATVCTFRAPRCDGCPVRAQCGARGSGRVGEFPPVVRRRATERVRRAVVVARRGRRWLLVRREGKRLAGLWEPPAAERHGAAAGRALAAALAQFGLRARLAPTGRHVRHRITHHAIEVEIWEARELRGRLRTGARWVDPADQAIAWTAMARRVARAMERGGGRAGLVPETGGVT